MPQAQPPLSGYRVLDLTRVRTGPTAVKQLGDWGADVIKIERPGGDDMSGPRHGSDFQNLHRNKRSMTLDLKRPEARALFRRMVPRADVVVENYRPAVKHRLGVDYESLRALNPRLVYASISGFGQEGPYAERPGVDQIAQGLGGLMSVTGPDGAAAPLRVGVPIADLCAGLYCALGILTALLERERSGEGQWGAHLPAPGPGRDDGPAGDALADGRRGPGPGRKRPSHRKPHQRLPDPGRFRERGGLRRASSSRASAGRSSVRTYSRTRTTPTEEAAHRNRHALDAIIEARTRTETTAHWVEALNAAGGPLRADPRHARGCSRIPRSATSGRPCASATRFSVPSTSSARRST